MHCTRDAFFFRGCDSSSPEVLGLVEQEKLHIVLWTVFCSRNFVLGIWTRGRSSAAHKVVCTKPWSFYSSQQVFLGWRCAGTSITLDQGWGMFAQMAETLPVAWIGHLILKHPCLVVNWGVRCTFINYNIILSSNSISDVKRLVISERHNLKSLHFACDQWQGQTVMSCAKFVWPRKDKLARMLTPDNCSSNSLLSHTFSGIWDMAVPDTGKIWSAPKINIVTAHHYIHIHSSSVIWNILQGIAQGITYAWQLSNTERKKTKNEETTFIKSLDP